MTAEPKRREAPLDIGTEANRLQFEATIPDSTIWVGASAGSGKTKVLAERVLRLMLPQGDIPAADPTRILCITFTKAAASEVMERIMRYCRDWTIAEEKDLIEKLSKLLGQIPDKKQLESARALFAKVLEAAGGMKIMTIHAFCQSVLARFPMEAGLPAGFEVMEEAEAKALMRNIRRDLIRELETSSNKHTELAKAFAHLAALKNADDIEKLMISLANERARLKQLLTAHGGIEPLCTNIRARVDAPEGVDYIGTIQSYMANIPADELRQLLAKTASLTSSTAKGVFKTLDAILSSPPKDWPTFFDDYVRLFYTRSSGNHKSPTKDFKDDTTITLYETEAARAEACDRTLRAIATADATCALLRFASHAIGRYEAQKRAANRLDYEDLIEKTENLLGINGVHWVHYKLDGGIDHILVDEAQDTNPDQWNIVSGLYDEFYNGLSRRENANRTTFVVGDEKQSIFSFQRADPRVFDTMRNRLERRAGNLGPDKFKNIPMRISFRSAPSILKVVDAVFNPPDVASCVTRTPEDSISHMAFHSGKAGHVELWPLLKFEKKDKPEVWKPVEIATADKPDNVSALADRVAKTISHMITDPQSILVSEGRRITAGDIMILVNKRKPFAESILKALRREGVPVNGIDRMVITKQIAVMDVLAAISFVLQPDDDLNLATLLKSPFIGMSETALMDLCFGRGPVSLWNRLRDTPACADIVTWLSGLLDIAGSIRAGEFISHILYAPCVTDGFSGLRALLGRLGADMRDPLQELMARADAYDANDVRGLQGFLQDMRNDTRELKRQIGEGEDRVRLMTVHGSKGLEAPIVFLPDTIKTSGSGKTEPILWPDRGSNDGVPLWAPREELRADAYKARVLESKLLADEEYRRLLYVALTRAGERLYIGGAEKSKNSSKSGCWYHHIEHAFESGILDNIKTDDDGTKSVSNTQTDPVKSKHKAIRKDGTSIEMPAWITAPAPAPSMPPKPLIPSRPDPEDDEETAAMSPLYGDISHRFKRGKIIHTLFQFLPDIPKASRKLKAQDWLARPAHELDENEIAEIMQSVFTVLDDPRFSDLFGEGSRAEIPLTGLIDTTSIVSGQIDRLVVTDHEIIILDFKTNRPAPKALEAVPEAYRRQMRTYRDLLLKIWPEKAVRCALLWTDGPDLMDITGIL